MLMMQKIANKLETVWNQMNIEFIEDEEEANMCLSTLSIFYQGNLRNNIHSLKICLEFINFTQT
jgi:hypothetical protein